MTAWKEYYTSYEVQALCIMIGSCQTWCNCIWEQGHYKTMGSLVVAQVSLASMCSKGSHIFPHLHMTTLIYLHINVGIVCFCLWHASVVAWLYDILVQPVAPAVNVLPFVASLCFVVCRNQVQTRKKKVQYLRSQVQFDKGLVSWFWREVFKSSEC